MVGFNKNSLDLYRGATNFCLGLRYLLRLPFTHTHTHIYIYIYIYIHRGGARNFGLGGPRLNYLVVSHNSRKTQNAMYMFLCIGLINVILIST